MTTMANELESQGVPFPEFQRRAFDLVKTEREASCTHTTAR
jgi:hypothetical protein